MLLCLLTLGDFPALLRAFIRAATVALFILFIPFSYSHFAAFKFALSNNAFGHKAATTRQALISILFVLPFWGLYLLYLFLITGTPEVAATVLNLDTLHRY